MRDSKIEWTHHTFNPWWGCEKVSPGCAHCYAESWSKRTGHRVRRFFGASHWKQPRKWNAAAAAAGERTRVFCASMADVFEDREDLIPHRARLFELIAETPWHFVSAEPLLGPIDMGIRYRPDWLIVGGESGPRARPMSPAWVEDLRDQCEGHTTFFF